MSNKEKEAIVARLVGRSIPEDAKQIKIGEDKPWAEPTYFAPEIIGAVRAIQSGMRRGVPMN